jgi:glyoxylase-like metal-dependent hydrolase (beta-lactamase superfamily II)
MVDSKDAIDIPAKKIEILPGMSCEIISTPGHSKGSLCFVIPAQAGIQCAAGIIKNPIVITGDTLFLEFVGRMDLPGGDESEMRQSLATLRAKNFPTDTLIIPGHGPVGTIANMAKTTHVWNNW